MIKNIKNFHNSLINKEFSCVEAIKDYIKRIEYSKTNSFITKTFESALESAEKIDKKISSGEKISILEGIPISIKDLYCTKGILTTCGSKMLSNFKPIYNATVVEKIIEKGAISMGKVNMDEFAMGSLTKNEYFGNVINPLKDKKNPNANLTAGGSSGGSAASVADNLCLASFGSDTGGSIRQPASLCGLVGYKPSYGICSRYGVISYASSFDTVSVISNSVEDSALIINAVKSYDPKDSTSVSSENIEQRCIDKNKIIVGIPMKFLENGKLNQYILDSINTFNQKVSGTNVEIIEIDMDYVLNYALDVYYLLTTVEAYSNLSKYDGIRYGINCLSDKEKVENLDEFYKKNRSSGFGTEVKRRLLLGGHGISGENYESRYLQAAKIRRIMKNKIDEIFKKCDIILTPTTNTVAFDLDAELDPIDVYKNDLFTVYANITGLPSISIPIENEKESGLPIGIMFSGRYLQDEYLIEKTKFFEDLMDYSKI